MTSTIRTGESGALEGEEKPKEGGEDVGSQRAIGFLRTE